MSSPDSTQIILECNTRLSEARNLLLESEKTDSSDLRTKALSIVDEVINDIGKSLQQIRGNFEAKIRLLKVRDSAWSLAFMIHVAEDNLESATRIGGSIPLSNLEYPSFSIALKAGSFIVARSKFTWPWDELLNIIKQFDAKIFEEARKSNRFDLWLLILFSGVVSKKKKKIKLACKHLYDFDYKELDLIICFASALEDKQAGLVLRNAETERLEYYRKSADASKTIKKNPDRYTDWIKMREVFSVKRMKDSTKDAPVSEGPYSEDLAEIFEQGEGPAMDFGQMRGVPGLTINDLKEMLRGDSSLMRGLAMTIIEAGGPEALMKWGKEMERKFPASRKSNMQASLQHAHSQCPGCREIIKKKTMELIRGSPNYKNPVKCPRCGTKFKPYDY